MREPANNLLFAHKVSKIGKFMSTCVGYLMFDLTASGRNFYQMFENLKSILAI